MGLAQSPGEKRREVETKLKGRERGEDEESQRRKSQPAKGGGQGGLEERPQPPAPVGLWQQLLQPIRLPPPPTAMLTRAQGPS